MTHYQQKKIETVVGFLQKNTPTKTTNVIVENVTVNLGTSYDSSVLDVTNIKSISLIGVRVYLLLITYVI